LHDTTTDRTPPVLPFQSDVRAAAPREVRLHALIVGRVLFASYGYFYQAGGWNQNS
jgi:hypothetical protein